MTTTDERRAAVRSMTDAGQSQRAIADALGVSHTTVQRDLAAVGVPDGTASNSGPTTDDYVAPADRVVPVPTREERLFQGGAVHPHQAFRPCPVCRHIAWRDAPGVDRWTCDCGPGPRTCHATRHTFAPFPVMPPEAA